MTATADPVDGAVEGAPLAGVRVVEVSSYLSGPFAAQVLVDLGAYVIKVEPPDGDPYRRVGPQHGDQGVMFRATNQGKDSLFIDLKTSDGLEEFHGLLGVADILISNWRPAVAGGFGLTAETVRERWPRLVWVRVSGFGQDGPNADDPAFDSIIVARSGLLAEMPGGSLPPMYIADKVTALMAAQSAMAALLRRVHTDTGAVIDIAMLDALAYFNAGEMMAGHLRVGQSDPGVLRQLRANQPLATSDGAIVMSPVSGRKLKAALEALGIADRADEIRTAPDPISATERFYAVMSERVAQLDTAAVVDALRTADVPVSARASIAEHFDDPQVLHNGTYRLVEDTEGGTWRRVRYPGLFRS